MRRGHPRMANFRRHESRSGGESGTGGEEAGIAAAVALFPRESFPRGAGAADLGSGIGEVSCNDKGAAEGAEQKRRPGADVKRGCATQSGSSITDHWCEHNGKQPSVEAPTVHVPSKRPSRVTGARRSSQGVHGWYGHAGGTCAAGAKARLRTSRGSGFWGGVGAGGGSSQANQRKFTLLAQIHRNMCALMPHATRARRCVRVHRWREADLALGARKIHHFANRGAA